MQKLKNALFSMELSGLLLILFAIAIGFATFIENDYGTIAAKARVYNARWFELLITLLTINMSGSIIKHKMYLKEKWTVFLFHIAFIVIFIGAGVTRYIGYEGMMSIREGGSSNSIMSDETYVSVWAYNEDNQYYVENKVFPIADNVEKVSHRFDLGQTSVDVEVLDYFVNVSEKIVEEEGGIPMLEIIVSGSDKGSRAIFLENKDMENYGSLNFSFNVESGDTNTNIKITGGGSELFFTSDDSVSFSNIMKGTKGILLPDTACSLIPGVLYEIGDMSFVVKAVFQSAKRKLISTDGQEGMKNMDGFSAKITTGDKSELVNVFGGKGFMNKGTEVAINGINIKIGYGSKPIAIPFYVRLDDFQLERYPGSNSPSSYSSEVTLIDKSNELEMPFKIYMNNTLNYRGYRFFQSSYDKDEMGTVLSVNHDYWGTIITYIGYFLMTLGMFMTIFNKYTRFRLLGRLSSGLRQSRKAASILFLTVLSSVIFPFMANADNSSPSALSEIDKDHAAKFGKLLVQDKDGRMKPLNTMASEVLRKLTRKNKFQEQNPEQIFLGMMVFPQQWQNVPMIKVAHPELKSYLKTEGKYAAFNQVVDISSGNGYLIRDFVERAYAKRPAFRNKFDKEVMKVDERINIIYMIYSGIFLTSFPVPGDESFKWVAAGESEDYFEGEEALFVNSIFSMYFEEVAKAVQSGDWSVADEHLGYIVQFQEKYGKEVLPADSKVKLEIFYNNFNIFKRLSYYYGFIGFILLILHFINILKPGINFRTVITISTVLVIILFIFHSAGLGLRWYISGHAPWSNGYESLIYIGWATILSGLIFVRRSEITLSVTALLTSVILMVAGMSWMDPEITNLVPVLKSYWLVIHVAIITASYGFLALGALLGFLNLILMSLKSRKNYERLSLTNKELSYIIEMTLIIGLFMMTIGTFLGGVWANESWGRYWGWDPKETWALVTVLIYSFVAHIRFIPGFKGNFVLSLLSLISYGTVLMTYFGVNYYLSGLHSYAKGDTVPVPGFVYYTLIVVALVGILAYISERRFIRISKKSG